MQLNHNDYWHWNNILTKQECENIINNLNDKRFKPAGIEEDNHIDTSIRETEIVWQDVMSPLGCILQAYINAANYYAGWRYDLRYMEKVQIGKYSKEKESFYDWHIDSAPPDNNEEQRKLSISVLLSDPKDFEGGKLVFKNLDENNNNKILSSQGSIVVFPSYMEHKVTPVTKGERYSAVSWMVGPKFRQIMIVNHKKYDNLDLVVIDEYYTPEELEEVKDEIKELMVHRMDGRNTGSAVSPKTGKLLKTGKGLWLDEVYVNNRNSSPILRYNMKIFTDELLDGLIKKSVFFRAIKESTKDTTLLNFYEDGEEYGQHLDNTQFTAITLLQIGDTKKGGLYFKDIDTEFKLKDNTTIIFPGCAYHQALPVECDPGSYRISIAHFINYEKDN